MAQVPKRSNSRVTYSPEAEDDLRETYSNTEEQWGTRQAEDYLEFLIDHVNTLAQMPGIARFVDNLKTQGVRVYTAKWSNASQGHRIFFSEIETGIYVLRVLHTKRNSPDDFG